MQHSPHTNVVVWKRKPCKNPAEKKKKLFLLRWGLPLLLLQVHHDASASRDSPGKGEKQEHKAEPLSWEPSCSPRCLPMAVSRFPPWGRGWVSRWPPGLLPWFLERLPRPGLTCRWGGPRISERAVRGESLGKAPAGFVSCSFTRGCSCASPTYPCPQPPKIPVGWVPGGCAPHQQRGSTGSPRGHARVPVGPVVSP